MSTPETAHLIFEVPFAPMVAKHLGNGLRRVDPKRVEIYTHAKWGAYVTVSGPTLKRDGTQGPWRELGFRDGEAPLWLQNLLHIWMPRLRPLVEVPDPIKEIYGEAGQ